MTLHAAWSGLRLPGPTSSGRANRFYVTFLAVLAAVKSSPTRFELRNPLLPMIVNAFCGASELVRLCPGIPGSERPFVASHFG